MQPYYDLLEHVLDCGARKGDRTGTGTYSVFGHQMRFDLSQGFPLITAKRVPWKAIVGELLWFIHGGTNVRWLQEHGITIWDEWANANGDLGPIYGHQWRSWPRYRGDNGAAWGPTGEIDQLANVIERIRSNPDCRRLIVSAWNVGQLEQMALMPCHAMFQFYVADGKLSCQLYQRSADLFLGVPFNIASYALLTHMIANITNLEVGEFIWTGGDCHLYTNHIEQTEELLDRVSRAPELPYLRLNPHIRTIDEYGFNDIELVDYNPLPAIKAPVAV